MYSSNSERTSDPIKLRSRDHAVAGFASGALTRFLCQPLDVLKIRFQLQAEPIRRSVLDSKYRGLWQASRLIVKEESLFALWKGHIPAQALSVVFGTVQFSAFEALSRHAWTFVPHSPLWLPVVSFTCGGLAGCFASAVSLPLDVLRTRLVGQGEPKVYTSIGNAVVQMYKREGILAFYRGFIATMLQIAPYTGLQFMFYALFKRIWDRVLFPRRIRGVKSQSQDRFSSVPESLICGSLAGVSSKTIVYPLDVIKKRLQVIGFEQARVPFGKSYPYRGFIDCLVSVTKHEGIPGLFKGLIPGSVKAAASTGLTFFFYEQTCRILRSHRRRQLKTTHSEGPS